jgi:hypothetical protein
LPDQPATPISIAARSASGSRIRTPGIGQPLWIDALVAASVYREWLINLGRRDPLHALPTCYVSSRDD